MDESPGRIGGNSLSHVMLLFFFKANIKVVSEVFSFSCKEEFYSKEGECVYSFVDKSFI